MTQRGKFGPVIGLLAVYAVVLVFAAGWERPGVELGDQTRLSQSQTGGTSSER